ncbi:MAG: hypothetical protein HQL44_10390 [Alphaproteobacteria bacterium]|nr:hypothetical protein [Alphaproteobacteria bacterium]
MAGFNFRVDNPAKLNFQLNSFILPYLILEPIMGAIPFSKPQILESDASPTDGVPPALMASDVLAMLAKLLARAAADEHLRSKGFIPGRLLLAVFLMFALIWLAMFFLR